MKKPIYFDSNATTPHDPEVVEAMRPYLEEEFGNPLSSQYYGSKPKQAAVAGARRKIASLLKCEPEEVVFTSGGTESNNFAIKGCAEAFRHKGNHIITSQIEHPAILEVCRFFKNNGFEIGYLMADEFGLVNVAEAAVQQF